MAIFELQGFILESGDVAQRLALSYRTHGRLNRDASNVIVFPTPFGANHQELDWLAGPEGLFDPDAYFIVIPDTFGNGLSTSPAMSGALASVGARDQGAAAADVACPVFSTLDNVRAQQRLLSEIFGIRQVALVAGWSMGGQQAYQWAAAFPEIVRRICVICGSARTAPHNFVFLDGIRAALQACLPHPAESGDAARERALRMAGRLYAGWALSQAFYREALWQPLGYASLEDFLVRYWEGGFLKRHPLNLLAQIQTWQDCDLARTPGCGGTLESALAAITAQVLLIPCRQDLYFRVEDNRRELPHLRHGVMQVMDSPWGHRAGLPVSSPADRQFLRSHLDALLRM